MISAIHLAMPRTRIHDLVHGIKGPAISAPTPRVQLPETQAITSDVMRNPHRELVMNNAGASFWASQALKEDKVGFGVKKYDRD